MPTELTPAALAELRAAAHEAKMREQCGMVHSSRDGGILADGVLAMLEIAEIHQADIRIIAGMAVKASEARAERDQLRLRVQKLEDANRILSDGAIETFRKDDDEWEGRKAVRCVYCFKEEWADFELHHEEDCPVLRAAAMLAEKGG